MTFEDRVVAFGTTTCLYCNKTFTLGNPCWNDDGNNCDDCGSKPGDLHLDGECLECSCKRVNKSTLDMRPV